MTFDTAIASLKKYKALVVAGGVSANSELRKVVEKIAKNQNIELFLNDISIINITYICKNKMKQKKPQIYYINCMTNKNK